MQVAIALSKLQRFNELLILHQIKGIEDVLVLIMGRHGEVITHESSERNGSCDVVVRVASIQLVVLLTLHYRRRKMVERAKIVNIASLREKGGEW